MYLIWFYLKKNLFKLTHFEYDRTAFSDLKEYGVKTIYFYKEDESVILDDKLKSWFDEIWVSIMPYNNIDEILIFLKSLTWKVFINTFEEPEIPLVNQIKKWLWQKISDNPDIFLNKYLQRKIIWKYYPETVVNFEVFSLKNICNFKETEYLHTPLIIKPTWWIQSSWVHKIDNIDDLKLAINDISNAFEMLKEKNLTSQNILIEEFISGDMYTIDYFVDEMGNIYSTAPIRVKLWIDYWINDFCNVARFIHKWDDIDRNKVLDFVKKTVVWWWIRNTFVHHEFKINDKWYIKTIEINWRIWWYRLDMYQKWYDINLLKMPFDTGIKAWNAVQNMAVFALYPKHEGILIEKNSELINEISKLPSFERIRILDNQIWKKVWFTKNGYSKMGSIVLVNNNNDQFEKDVSMVEKSYFDILKIK